MVGFLISNNFWSGFWFPTIFAIKRSAIVLPDSIISGSNAADRWFIKQYSNINLQQLILKRILNSLFKKNLEEFWKEFWYVFFENNLEQFFICKECCTVFLLQFWIFLERILKSFERNFEPIFSKIDIKYYSTYI